MDYALAYLCPPLSLFVRGKIWGSLCNSVMLLFGFLLCLTIIGAVLGVPLIFASVIHAVTDIGRSKADRRHLETLSVMGDRTATEKLKKLDNATSPLVVVAALVFAIFFVGFLFPSSDKGDRPKQSSVKSGTNFDPSLATATQKRESQEIRSDQTNESLSGPNNGFPEFDTIKYIETKKDWSSLESQLSLYYANGDINTLSLAELCLAIQKLATEKKPYLFAIFDRKESANFPTNPFSAMYDGDDEIQRHIRALYYFDSRNGYSELRYHDENIFEHMPCRIKVPKNSEARLIAKSISDEFEKIKSEVAAKKELANAQSENERKAASMREQENQERESNSKAANALNAVKVLTKSNPEAAKKKLDELIEKYGDTASGNELRSLRASLD